MHEEKKTAFIKKNQLTTCGFLFEKVKAEVLKGSAHFFTSVHMSAAFKLPVREGEGVMLIRSLLRAAYGGTVLRRVRQRCCPVRRETHHCSAVVYREHSHNTDTLRYGQVRAGHICLFIHSYSFIIAVDSQTVSDHIWDCWIPHDLYQIWADTVLLSG